MRTLSVFIISLFFGLSLSAQSLSSEVSSDSILLGNYFIYEIKVENLDAHVEFPSLNDFQIVSGPNQSSSVSIINGDKTSTKTYTWYLEPVDLGQYFIEPLAMNVDGEVYEADPIEINVYPNPDGLIIKPKENNSMDDFFNLNRPDLFGPRTPRPKTPAPPKTPSKPKRELKKG